jgi:hypothetical protein
MSTIARPNLKERSNPACEKGPMFTPPPRSDTLLRLQKTQEQIALLLPRLVRANKAYAEAARPLVSIADLDFDHRRQLAGRIRAANQEWEDATKLIHEALASLNQHDH